MAWGYHHDAVQWLAADGVATEYTIGSLGFTPKAVMCWCMGLQNAAEAASNTVDARVCIGYAESGGVRRAATIYSQDTADPSNCGAGARDDCIIAVCDGAAAFTGMLDIAFDSDGIRLIVDDATPANLTVFVQIWGGDITAVVGDIAEPGATGNVDYTATGMVASAVDQILLLAGVQSTAALNSAAATDAGLFFGVAANATDQWVTACNEDDASATMDTDHYSVSGECLAQIVLGGGGPNARAAFVQWNTNGFRLNWLERTTTSRRSIFLAMKGGQWDVGEYTIDVQTINNTATVSGIPFQPSGLCIATGSGAEETADAGDTLGAISIGCGTSTSSRRMQAFRSNTGAATCEIQNAVRYECVVAMMNNSAATRTRQDINAINSDGFQIIVDQANAADVTNWWNGYFAFAPAAVNIDAGVEALTFTGLDAGIASDRDIAAGVEALTLTGQDATVALANDTNIDAGVEALVLTGLDAGIDRDIAAGTEALLLTGQDAGIASDRDIAAGTEALLLDGQAAEVALVQDVPANTEALLLTGQDAGIASDRDIAAGTEQLVLDGLAATISTDRDIAAGVEALLLDGHTAAVGADTDTEINAQTEALVLTGLDAGIASDRDIAAGVEALTFTGLDAGIASDRDIAAGLAQLVLDGLPAMVGIDRDIAAGAEALLLSALPATVVADIGILAGTEALLLTGKHAIVVLQGLEVHIPEERIVTVATRNPDTSVEPRSTHVEVSPRYDTVTFT